MALSPQELSDRIEIDDLLVRYTAAIDDKDWELLDTVFTPDAQIDYVSSGGIAGAYPEVREWLGKALSIFPVTIHAITNSRIELDGDTAKGRTLVSNPMKMPKPDGAFWIFHVYAYYHDELVRTDQGWRIAKRVEEQLLLDGDVPAGLDTGA
jgi:3-phenylpropionate/cinnamic acid dioxygenase small subunit